MTLFTDFSQGPGATTAAVANSVALGDLTLPQTARMITRIWITHGIVGTFAADEPCVGYVKVTSEHCDIAPMYIPLEPLSQYKTLGSVGGLPPTKWLVNCPCPGGTVLSFETVVDEGVAGHEVQVTVEFSDGGTPFAGGQLHMKVAEPAVTMSATDNAETALTDITFKGSRIVMWGGYIVYETALVADTSTVNTVSMTSDDFQSGGPHKSAFNPQMGGDANGVGGGASLTKIETDIPFRVGGQSQTVSCAVTMRDAIATNPPLCNWFIVYQ